MEKEYVNAPFLKRGVAFVIDALMAFIPALVMYFIFAKSNIGLTPVYYPAPIIGGISMIDLPKEVNESVSIVESDEGGVISTTNYSMTATLCRTLSVVVIIFYVGYSAFCTILYDGKTIGKKLMRLKVVTDGEENLTKALALREIVGKIVINSTVIVPVISLVMALAAPKRKTIHDYIGKTRVVEDICRQD